MDVPVFSVAANPSCMYMTRSLKDAVIRFRRAIARKQGLAVVLGDNGLGKSSLLKFLSAGYENDAACNVSYFSDTRKFKTTFEFIKMICADFDIPPKRSQTAQMGVLEEFLTANHIAGRSTLIFIDEAQRLSLEMLELIRALLNYETDTEKMVQVILSGQLNLRDRLLEKDYKAFLTRIAAPYLMPTLTLDETIAMLDFRCEAWGVQNPFTRHAAERIYELSGGIPRETLLLAQGAYDYATDAGRQSVDLADVNAALQARAITEAAAAAVMESATPV